MYRRLESNPTSDQIADDELMNANDVAALLRMTPAWVYSETRRDRIPHQRCGRYFRYRRSAIEAWMVANERGSVRVRHSDLPGPAHERVESESR